MNFLSHYYFERFASVPEQVLGGLLPDLLKNVDKNYSFQLQKLEQELSFHPKSKAITEGWHRHVEVDKLFHGSDFFYEHTHRIRKQIEHVVEDLPVRSSFLAHISLELLLDHLLIEQHVLNAGRLYEHLEAVDRKVLTVYLQQLGGVDIDRFFDFYDRFLQSRYIFDYREMDNLPHALYSICKRVWDFEVGSRHFEELSKQLEEYKRNYLENYREIYTFIQDKIA